MRDDIVISDVRLTPFSIPYREPVVWAYGRLDAGDHVLIECVTSDGKTGLAEAIPRLSIYGETQDSIEGLLREVIAPRLIGSRLWSAETLDRIHTGIANNNVARGAVEQAVWWARAMSAGLTLRQLLGGGVDEVPVGWMVGLADEETMVAEGREAYGRGFRSFKVKGGSEVDLDIAVYRRLREVAPDALIYIDANLGYSWSEARRVARELHEHGLTFLEEPLGIGDPARTHLWLETGVGLIADETATTAHDAWIQLSSGAAQAISIKISRTGIADSLRIAGMCAAAGKHVVVGTQGESTLGTRIAAEVAASFAGRHLLTTELSHDGVFVGSIADGAPTRRGSSLLLSSHPDDLIIDKERLAVFAA